jgi:tetratricopeptide (TPR) repeat protein
MLFDLRGRGRRRTIQAVYVFLALLIGGGLIFFGVGTGTNSGGLLNGLSQSNGSANGTKTYANAVTAARKLVAASPNSAASWLALAKADEQYATGVTLNAATETYGKGSSAYLTEMQQAWEKYLSLAPANPDSDTARAVAAALLLTTPVAGVNPNATPLDANTYTDMSNAQEIVAAAASPQTAQAWQTAAEWAYLAGQTDKAILATRQALQLTPKLQQAGVKSEITKYQTYAQEIAAQKAEQKAGINTNTVTLPHG